MNLIMTLGEGMVFLYGLGLLLTLVALGVLLLGLGMLWVWNGGKL